MFSARALPLLLPIGLLLILAGCSDRGKPVTGRVQGYISLTPDNALAVTRSSDNPLAGVAVRLQGSTLSTLTKDDGSFILDKIPAGSRVLVASHDGHQSLAITVNVVAGQTVIADPNNAITLTNKWTVLVYMAADNDLEPVGLDDFNEMEQVGSTDRVKVVVQFDRSTKSWGTLVEAANENWSGARRYLIEQDNDPTVIHSRLLETLNAPTDMGQPSILRDFLNWGMEYEPAEHYLVVLWNHGTGWDPYYDRSTVTPRAIAIDDETNSAIRDIDLPAALTARYPIDIVATDACSMGMLEVAYEIRAQADFLVGAEEETPAEGFNYATMLAKLVSDQGLALAPAQVAVLVAKDAFDDWTKRLKYSYATSSVITLSETPNVAIALDGLTKRLLAIRSIYPSELTSASQQTERFSYTASMRFADLSHYAAMLSQLVPDSELHNQAANVQSAVAAAVLANYTASGRPQAKGISVFFPDATFYVRYALNGYQLLQSSSVTSWDEWLAQQPAAQ